MAYGTAWQQALYRRVPAPIRDVMATVYGIQQRRARYGEAYRTTLRELENTEQWSQRKVTELQLERLQEFLVRADAESPFHRSRFARVGFSPRSFRSVEDLRRLPVMTKADVRDHSRAIRSTAVAPNNIRLLRTSGTTGTPLHIPMHISAFQREYAFRSAHYRWGGVSLDSRERMAFAFGHPVASSQQTSPPFWVHDHANNWLLFSSYHLAEEHLPSYVEELERFRPVMLAGYPSSLSLIAAAYARYGKGSLGLRCVFAASETLLVHQRELLETSFRCPVLIWYGNTEMCANIVQCKHGSLHGRMEHSFLEVLDDNDEPAREGRLVCTGFGNPALPLIRYDIGDRVRLSDKDACTCGRPGQFFDSIVGRAEDYVITPTGRLVGRLDHLFKDAANIREAQLEQRDPKHLLIRIVRQPGFGAADESAILKEARLRLGDEISIAFEYVSAIPRTRTGKFRFIVTTLSSNMGAQDTE